MDSASVEARFVRTLREAAERFFQIEHGSDPMPYVGEGNEGFAYDVDPTGRGDLFVVSVAHVQTRQFQLAAHLSALTPARSPDRERDPEDDRTR